MSWDSHVGYMTIIEHITVIWGRWYTKIAWNGEMWFSQVKSWCHHWKMREWIYSPTIQSFNLLFPLWTIPNFICFLFQHEHGFSFLCSKIVPFSIPQVITTFSMQAGGSCVRPVERTNLKPYSCQNQGFHLTSSRAFAKAYLILMDDVYHTIAFQASVHFRLPSDFGKLLKEGFVNIIEAESFSCAIQLV